MPGPPRSEYPRPRLRRQRWTTLNGVWRFAFDDAGVGLAERWHDVPAAELDAENSPFDRDIVVPFCHQAKLSGIGERERHDIVWYARRFEDVRGADAERLLCHFGAVDYRATVWVNGRWVADHEGGHTPFAADVTDALGPHDNVVVVRAEDPLDDLTIPRGKQYWGRHSENIFYTATTGIWQSVWLEPVPAAHITDLRATPDLDDGAVNIEITLVGTAAGSALRVLLAIGDLTLADDRITVTGPTVRRRFSVVPPRGAVGSDAANWQGVATWSPEYPRLHDLRVELETPDGVRDTVDSYVGMRKVDARDGRLHLNNRPYDLRLVLDQGYFPDGLLTAPTDDDLRRDVELAKELGFNGARKHQKVEDPRWLYWADRLGLLVWGEMANAYQFSADAVRRITSEWQAVVARDASHPSVVAWVPMNESWGVPNLASDPRQRALLLTLYHLTHALDGTRPVVSNDGWEHALTDLLTVHDYGDAADLVRRYTDHDTILRAQPCGRPLHTAGHGYAGQPILLTEFGGIAVGGAAGGHGAEVWGYRTVADGDALLGRYVELLTAVAASPALAGFCYTQLTDVEQEVNGLLTADRKPKFDLDLLHQRLADVLGEGAVPTAPDGGHP